MAYKIEDNTGSCNGLKVDALNRAYVNAVDQTQADFYVRSGHSYNTNTGTINLTNGSESGILYMLNNEDEDIVIPSFIYLLGNSTGGTSTEDIEVKIYKNPTGGTLISGGTDFVPVNRDFGSANTLGATVKKGAQGSTITGGTVALDSLFPSSGRQVVAVETILPKGASVAISVTPRSTNSSMNVQIAIAAYLNKFNL